MIRRIRYGKQLTSKYSPYNCDIRTKANLTTIICTDKSTFRNKFVNSTNQHRKRSSIQIEQSAAATTTATSGHNIGDSHNNIIKTTDKTKFRNHFVYLLIVIFISITFADMVTAGTCWAKRNQNGKCKHPMERNVTKEKCCSNGDDVGFTEKEMNEFEYFFATALGDGRACSSCIESCNTAKCGPQRQCVIRQGQPKCVCAPNCKQNQRHHRSERRQNNALHQQIKSKRQQFQTSTKSTTTTLSNLQNKRLPTHHIQLPLIEQRKSQLTNRTTDHNHSTNSHRLRKFQTKHSTTKIFNNGSQHYIKTNTNNQRRQITNSNSNNHDEWEDEIRSRFHGHDLPYPPDDLQFNVNHQYHRAVCGTDGKTYKTECQLKKRACRQETTSLSVAYKGQCQTSCKHVKCSAGEHCLEDQNLMPHCVTCSITCPPYDPAMKSTIVNPSRLVCGVDGNTYRNLCEIKRTACMLGRSIPVAYRGPCRENANCDNIKCKDRQVCLNDLITHRPRCISCSFKCPRRKTPQGQRFIKICGVNNKSYHSWCQMMRDSCNTGYFIDVKHNGMCHNAAHNSTMRI